MVKCLKSHRLKYRRKITASYARGQVIKVSKEGFHVACADKTVLIKEVQPEAGKVMPAHSFVAGYKIAPRFFIRCIVCDIIPLMSQLRKDPIVGRWTIIATERARRPAAFVDPQSTATRKKDCPYCQDIASPGVHESHGVKVINSSSPILDDSKPFERQRAWAL